MNHAEVLCHSSGPWKNHKYFQNISNESIKKGRYFKTYNDFIKSEPTPIDRGRQVIDELFGNENQLEHHGIKGQKWGVRRYQNYDGTRIKSSEAEYHRYRTGQKKNFDDSKSKSGMSAFLSRNENMRTAHITRSDRPGEYWAQENSQWTNANIEPRSFEESMSKVNYLRASDPDNLDYQNNCVNCSVNMINQKKGFGTAAGPNADGVANEAIGYYFDGAVRENPSYDRVEETILNHGNGSYGVMGTKTKFGNGHETVWEVQDDQVWVYDGQTNNGQGAKRTFQQYKDEIGIEPWDIGTSVYDLTNATPNFEHQAEDHAFFPSVDTPDVKFSTHWKKGGREYYGPSKEDTTFTQRWEAYGLR